MTKARLIKRLKWYYPAEKFHAFVTFPLIILYLIGFYAFDTIVFIVYGLLVCTLILYQGQYYWKMKLKVLLSEPINQNKTLNFFRNSRKVNLVLFMLIPVVLGIQLKLQDWNFNSNTMLYWGILANVFAVLEHINYYHMQLMVDNKHDLNYLKRNRHLKKASLAKDLKENKI